MAVVVFHVLVFVLRGVFEVSMLKNDNNNPGQFNDNNEEFCVLMQIFSGLPGLLGGHGEKLPCLPDTWMADELLP